MYLEKTAIVLIAWVLLALPAGAQEEYEIESLPINTRLFDELAPVMVEDGIVFCSNRKSSVISRHYTEGQDFLYDVYYAERKDSLRWGRVREYADRLSSVFNEGPLSISDDGNTIYFTRNLETGRRGKRAESNKLGIFIADYNGNEWGNIRPFAHNMADYNTAHPALSKDGMMLFFASDRPGGFGQSDLYVCTKTGNEWSQPVNLGSGVNTTGSEMYPYYHERGRLYFASDGHGGLGGLDILYTLRTGNRWISPVALAEPFNSSADDFAFTAGSRLLQGYFTTNREKSDDIYRFFTRAIRLNNCPPPEEVTLCYELFESNAMEFDTMPFIYEWDFGDGGKARGIKTTHCFPGPGNYLIRLNVIDLIQDTIAYNEASYQLNIERIQQGYITAPDTCYQGESVFLDATASYLPDWEIGEYIWSFDDGTNGSGETTEKVFAAPGVYDVQLIIRSEPGADGAIRETCVSKIIRVEERNE